MPKANLGVKRVCPETGNKFYDLNKDPIVSPYTGMEYPLSYFEEVVAKTPKPTKDDTKPADDEEAAKDESEEDEDEDADTPELDEVPLDMGDDDEDGDDAAPSKGAAAGEGTDDLEGFSDDEADLDDDSDDDGLLLDDEDDDGLGDVALGGDDDED